MFTVKTIIAKLFMVLEYEDILSVRLVNKLFWNISTSPTVYEYLTNKFPLNKKTQIPKQKLPFKLGELKTMKLYATLRNVNYGMTYEFPQTMVLTSVVFDFPFTKANLNHSGNIIRNFSGLYIPEGDVTRENPIMVTNINQQFINVDCQFLYWNTITIEYCDLPKIDKEFYIDHITISQFYTVDLSRTYIVYLDLQHDDINQIYVYMRKRRERCVEKLSVKKYVINELFKIPEHVICRLDLQPLPNQPTVEYIGPLRGLPTYSVYVKRIFIDMRPNGVIHMWW